MKYRAAYTTDGTVVNIAYDTNQSGAYTPEEGANWATFTFDEIPSVPFDSGDDYIPMFRVENNAIRVITEEEFNEMRS